MAFSQMVLGLATENRTLNALSEEHAKKPRWFKGAAMAGPLADLNGVDMTIDTDVGLIPVQIKSSDTGAAEYRRKYPAYKNVVVIVIKRYTDDDEIRHLVFTVIGKRRKKIQYERKMRRQKQEKRSRV
ncbi:hypothetical protein A3C20_01255 [Candidatus Kaiserbacteria bacterium RIFCSPHIGHO2_02_FULL_55_25]|uniref:DUF4365 domain-containing protein n=1 Tax=Candidatus Kaiserbacteria bacterium RIFCSPHIGHO2_02_FULL_55_25 TaxID=1798498 RepID=A0A1F6EAA8_9BACT|nr:MAG: hypothetical protein A2764_00355 [Candidatus Kaiserbacteria bacterium RIFCSPHIGHO2_01_FULL_55_79]OGG70624.1 MAG: hypothetical protein A3C20_01255 [Candidatus Kaiserbacteria bacterium RIFCSPHIGHO2_02_FULL_55_25]OGG78738.1 MAG: hypothetical protein A3F56_00815 [Candidatus Kaiserbacteria bacterium RIFCSPHIGHO2_12_FULL_55_13]OGG82701.1 MAG: hypothetical protein A3A42_02420 [Candidatus Kaiserbacteria bacterium RIFCSPLOWO2_01_FULL_55_25]